MVKIFEEQINGYNDIKEELDQLGKEIYQLSENSKSSLNSSQRDDDAPRLNSPKETEKAEMLREATDLEKILSSKLAVLECDVEAVRKEISCYFVEQRAAFAECFALHEEQTRRVSTLTNNVLSTLHGGVSADQTYSSQFVMTLHSRTTSADYQAVSR